MSRENPTVKEKDAKQNKCLGVRKFRWARKCKKCGCRTYIGTKNSECKACVLAALPPLPASFYNNASIEDYGAYLPTPQEIEAGVAKFRAEKLERLRLEVPNDD
jgi:hypothetical protein